MIGLLGKVSSADKIWNLEIRKAGTKNRTFSLEINNIFIFYSSAELENYEKSYAISFATGWFGPTPVRRKSSPWKWKGFCALILECTLKRSQPIWFNRLVYGVAAHFYFLKTSGTKGESQSY